MNFQSYQSRDHADPTFNFYSTVCSSAFGAIAAAALALSARSLSFKASLASRASLSASEITDYLISFFSSLMALSAPSATALISWSSLPVFLSPAVSFSIFSRSIFLCSSLDFLEASYSDSVFAWSASLFYSTSWSYFTFSSALSLSAFVTIASFSA